MNIGGTIKLAHYFGAGLTLGLIPNVRLSYYGEAEVSYQHLDFYGRIYPGGGSFFFGAGAGYVTIEGSLSKTMDITPYVPPAPGQPSSITYESKGSVRTLVLTPVIGFLHTFGSGFSIGVDGGIQLPIAPSEIEFESRVSGDLPQPIIDQYLTPQLTPTDEAVRSTLETIGRTPLPTFNLRLGWLL